MITSSGLGSMPASGLLTYSCSKAFASYLAMGLNYELKDKIDVMTYEAGEVSTKLLRKKPSMFIATTDVASRYSLRDLGSESKTYGTFIHDVLMGVSNLIPLRVF